MTTKSIVTDVLSDIACGVAAGAVTYVALPFITNEAHIHLSKTATKVAAIGMGCAVAGGLLKETANHAANQKTTIYVVDNTECNKK